MKRNAFRNCLAFALGSAFMLTASAETRTWTSANGQKTFDGELLSYNSTTGMVKVKRADGSELAFKQTILSTDDIEFLNNLGDVAEKSEAATSSGTSTTDGSTIQAKAVPDQLPRPDDKEADMSKPVQVFILMGQSNMLGFGKISGGEGSLENACKTKGLYPYLVDESGNWTTRKDVRNVRIMNMQMFNDEWMTITGKAIGPEIGIGHYLGHAMEEPVMILKSCIGNRSLGWDLLPPGSQAYEHDGKLQPGYGETPSTAGSGKKHDGGEWYAGKQYDDDIASVKHVLNNLDKHYPGAKGYEVAGFFWWQGDKDMRNPAHFERYEHNLVNLIKALRKEFNAPKAKFVSASLGQTKEGSTKGDGKILDAMKAVANSSDPELKGHVGFVYSHPLSKGGSSSGHYSGNAETYMNVGEAMGKAMVELFQGK